MPPVGIFALLGDQDVGFAPALGSCKTGADRVGFRAPPCRPDGDRNGGWTPLAPFAGVGYGVRRDEKMKQTQKEKRQQT